MRFNKTLYGPSTFDLLQVSGGMNTSTYSSSAASLSQSSPKPTTDSASDLSAVAASLSPPTHTHHSTTAHHDSLMPAAPTATFGNTTVGGELSMVNSRSTGYINQISSKSHNSKTNFAGSVDGLDGGAATTLGRGRVAADELRRRRLRSRRGAPRVRGTRGRRNVRVVLRSPSFKLWPLKPFGGRLRGSKESYKSSSR